MGNDAMNRLILQAAGRAPRRDTRTEFARRYSDLCEDYAQAVNSGDEIAIEMANQRIDELVAEARAARAAAQPEAPPPVSFDGGVRGRRPGPAPPAGARVESAAQLFRRALARSLAEREERGDDPTIVVRNR
jgi:hypothetical protein